MSAIYGYCHWSDKQYAPVIEQMENSLGKYKIDSFSNLAVDSVEFGCGLQLFTQEAERERLPLYNKRRAVLVTADVVLDNRKELLRQLGIEVPTIPDGELVYEAYCKWGEEFVKLLRGVFGIAIYDLKKETLFLYTDHTASRTVNYYHGKKGLAFATTLAPIRQVCSELEMCEKWMTACQAMCGEGVELFGEMTPVENVRRLEAGTYVCISEHGFEKKTYWNPLKHQGVMPFYDSNCSEMFRTTMELCVKDMLRSRTYTGAMVSSGLDSAVVTCLAAKDLEKEGKKLRMYTAVPEQDYQTTSGKYGENEAWGAELIQKKHSNSELKLLPCKGLDGFSGLRRITELMEMPVKAAADLMWYEQIYQQAAEDGCGIVLGGQYGDATISYGNIYHSVYHMLTHGHYVKCMKEIMYYAQSHATSVKRVWRSYLQEWKQNHSKTSIRTHSLVRKDLVDKHGVKEQMIKEWDRSGKCNTISEEQRNGQRFNPIRLQQQGRYETLFSLSYGVLLRDPTKDKRIIELCVNMPVEAMIHNGVDRRLVREYMGGTVPMELLNVLEGKGSPSGDAHKRVLRHWPEKKEEVMEVLKRKECLAYLDEEQISMLCYKMERLESLPEYEQKTVLEAAYRVYALNVYMFNYW